LTERVLQRVRTERDHRVLGAADDLVHVDVVEERQAAAAELRRMAERPQARGLRLAHEARHRRVRVVVAAIEHRLGGIDALLDEPVDLVADRTDVRRYFEAHGRDA
jgi:hypothetical protein